MSAPIPNATHPFPAQGGQGGWFERHRALEAVLVTLGSAALGAPFVLLVLGGLFAGF